MPLQAKTIQQGDGPHLLISAGVHGDEYEPMLAVRKMETLLHDRKWQGRVTLVPCINEPAFRLGRRRGADDLDLARVCPGDSNGSPTMRLANEISNLIETADFYIDLHTGGIEFEVFPLAGYTLHKDPAILAWQRRMAQAFNLPVVWGTSGELDGRTLSVARDANVPAIYTEYRGGSTCWQEGVDAYVSGCLNVMREIGMLDGECPDSKIQYNVEDARPSSGHMQLCNPAPHDGIFLSTLSAGDAIRSGDPIGTVIDLFDPQRETQILAHADGILLTRRLLPKILAGDSAGVVLEASGG